MENELEWSALAFVREIERALNAGIPRGQSSFQVNVVVGAAPEYQVACATVGKRIQEALDAAADKVGREGQN